MSLRGGGFQNSTVKNEASKIDGINSLFFLKRTERCQKQKVAGASFMRCFGFVTINITIVLFSCQVHHVLIGNANSLESFALNASARFCFNF